MEYTEKNYLENLIAERRRVTIFFMNGFQLHGVIVGEDINTVFFHANGKAQMIYKHAISTVCPEDRL